MPRFKRGIEEPPPPPYPPPLAGEGREGALQTAARWLLDRPVKPGGDSPLKLMAVGSGPEPKRIALRHFCAFFLELDHVAVRSKTLDRQCRNCRDILRLKSDVVDLRRPMRSACGERNSLFKRYERPAVGKRFCRPDLEAQQVDIEALRPIYIGDLQEHVSQRGGPRIAIRGHANLSFRRP